jgi:hypothetical protein
MAVLVRSWWQKLLSAIYMILQLFLRPACAVIGLIVGMIVCFVSLAIIIYNFTHRNMQDVKE